MFNSTPTSRCANDLNVKRREGEIKKEACTEVVSLVGENGGTFKDKARERQERM